jgi:hypothetical protein
VCTAVGVDGAIVGVHELALKDLALGGRDVLIPVPIVERSRPLLSAALLPHAPQVPQLGTG